MEIEEKLITSKPREEAGSKTSRKYQFQKDLSLFLLIDQHTKRDDYLFLFDFHEDLIISDSATIPSKFDFYQIKSKDTKGNWTIKAVTRSAENKNSILGKLYLNKIIFQDATSSLNFISNSSFGFKNLVSGQDAIKMKRIHATDLSKTDKEICAATIKKEHKISGESEFEKLTEFHVTKLSNYDSSTHCMGALGKLINSINPENKINYELAYNQVFNEITRRTNETVGDKPIDSINDIFEIKGISKTQFISFLEHAGLYKSVEQEWLEVKDSLEVCKISYVKLMKYKSAWREMSARLVKDTNSIPLQGLIDEIEENFNSTIDNGELEEMNLEEIVNSIFTKVEKVIFGEYFTKCLIIKKINES